TRSPVPIRTSGGRRRLLNMAVRVEARLCARQEATRAATWTTKQPLIAVGCLYLALTSTEDGGAEGTAAPHVYVCATTHVRTQPLRTLPPTLAPLLELPRGAVCATQMHKYPIRWVP